MKNYQAPELNIVELELANVILTSPATPTEGEDDMPIQPFSIPQ